MKTYIEAADVELLEKAATSLRDRLLIRLLFRLGCRISEALALSIYDIDFEKGLVTILHLKCRVKLICLQCKAQLSRSSHFCPNCGNKVDIADTQENEHSRRRTLPIDKETMEILKDYILSQDSILQGGRKIIFNINRHRAWQIIKQCAQEAGLPALVNPETGKVRGVSPHRLRDAFAVHAVKLNDTGDGLRLLQEHLGHASFNTTAKYRKVAGEEHRRWYDQLWKHAE